MKLPEFGRSVTHTAAIYSEIHTAVTDAIWTRVRRNTNTMRVIAETLLGSAIRADVLERFR
jgi:hypothetical protein